MAVEYVSQVLLEVNGQQIDDFSGLTEAKVEGRKTIQLMNKWGFVSIPKIYPVNVDYVVPADGPEFDFESIADGTLTIDKQNGVRLTFSHVYWLSTGDTKYEGGKEATRTIELAALARNQV